MAVQYLEMLITEMHHQYLLCFVILTIVRTNVKCQSSANAIRLQMPMQISMFTVCKVVLYRREAHPTEGFPQMHACLFSAVKSISERNRTAGVIKVTDYATVYAYAVPRSVYPRKTSAMKHAAWQEYCKRHTSWNICHAPAIVYCSVELIHKLRTAGGKTLLLNA